MRRSQQSNVVLSKIEIPDMANENAPNHKSDYHPLCSFETQGRQDTRFIEQLWEDYGHVFQYKDWNNFGPDSSFRLIRLIHKGKPLTLKSWHPIYEKNKNAVVTTGQ